MKKRIQWNIKMITNEASKYNSVTDFRKNSFKAYKAAYRKKILKTLFS